MELLPPLLSYAGTVMAAAFVAVALWEHARPERPLALPDGPRWRVNLGLLAIRKLIELALAPMMAAVAAFVLSRAGLLPAAETGLGAVAHGIAMLLALDLGNYLAHRALHAVPWLWRLHAVHHTDLALDVSTSVRGHPVESVLVGLFLVVWGGILGAQPSEALAYAALAFSVQLVAHANVRLPARLQALLGPWLITPVFHRLHHVRDDRLCHANFGAVLVLWDRLFGTAVQPATATPPAAFGVNGYVDPRSQRLGPLLLQPLQPSPPSSTSYGEAR